jgi:uncharacterized membrane protein (UPF0127 family)
MTYPLDIPQGISALLRSPASAVAAPLGGLVAVLRRLGVLLALLVATAPIAACSSENSAVFHTATGDWRFNVEVVDNDQTRAQGLMFRQSLAPDAGMLFDFLEEREVSFWMRNTFIPLDMVFIGADGIVKAIHVNARPQDPTAIPSGVPVRFVLEIPGGRSVEIGLEPGDRFEHARVGSKAP